MTGRALMLLGAGFTVWAVAFVLLYGMLSVGCAFGWHEILLAGVTSLQRLQLVVLFLVHLSAIALLTVMLRRTARRSFLHAIGYGAAGAALAATVFTYGAVFFLSPCL